MSYVNRDNCILFIFNFYGLVRVDIQYYNRDSFISSFLICIPCISFSCLIIVATYFSTIWIITVEWWKEMFLNRNFEKNNKMLRSMRFWSACSKIKDCTCYFWVNNILHYIICIFWLNRYIENPQNSRTFHRPWEFYNCLYCSWIRQEKILIIISNWYKWLYLPEVMIKSGIL